jgi:hypothetical protein
VRAHHDLKQFQVSQHPFLICLMVVHLALVVHRLMLHVLSNLHSPPIAMDMALPVSFSPKEFAHEQ